MANKMHLQMLHRGVTAWNAWRQERSEIRIDLSDADLNGGNLSGVNFTGGNLSGVSLDHAILTAANLSGAHLNFAHLRRADLIRANLSHAGLSHARFDGAILSEADLSHAIMVSTNLYGGNLSRARLRNADLSRAQLGNANLFEAELGGARLNHAMTGGTIFGNIDLGHVIGLEEINHKGPSEISISTFYRTERQIPEVFLRGCGVPENFLTFLPSLTAQALDFYSCFISYSHADKSFARRLHDTLQGRGIRCWLDEHQLLPGQKIYTEVDRGIRLWDKVLLCCSQAALKSWWVDNEIKIAFDKEQRLWQERGQEVLALIPLNLDGYLFSGEWRAGLATEVKSRLAADFTGWGTDNGKFEEQFERLVRALCADASGRELPPTSKL